VRKGRSLSYILTFDYELFGSGKGDVFKHLINPTKSILAILKKLNIKATFFVEQLEVDAIIDLKNCFAPESYEHMQAIAVEQQLADIIQQGHDIQLHLHPQWVNAQYIEGHWQLNFDWWRFSALPYRSDNSGIPGRYDLIKQGKASLEKRLQKLNPDYQCTAFRAGGYNIGNDKQSIDALINNGIKLDSSVCPGFFSSSSFSNYDYTAVDEQMPYWQSSYSLLIPSNSPVAQCLELPLLSIRSTFTEKLSLARLYSQIKNRHLKKLPLKRELLSQPENPEMLTNANFDVCLSSRTQIKRFINQSQRLNEIHGDDALITLIGHPKDFSIFSPLTRILCILEKNNQFITVDSFYKKYSSR